MDEITNARILSTQLGYEDHGILTCFLYLKREVGEQGFGGYGLDDWSEKDKQRVGKGIEVIAGILKAVGVDKWEALPGKYIRVRQSNPRGKIDAIGHIVEDKWFSFQEVYGE